MYIDKFHKSCVDYMTSTCCKSTIHTTICLQPCTLPSWTNSCTQRYKKVNIVTEFQMHTSLLPTLSNNKQSSSCHLHSTVWPQYHLPPPTIQIHIPASYNNCTSKPSGRRFQSLFAFHQLNSTSTQPCKHVAYYSPPNVHIYSLLAEQLCCSVMSLLV